MSKNPKWDDYIKKYPNLFKEYPRCGISIGVGWLTLLDTLCLILEYAILRMPEELRDEIYVVQIKEKFSGLRVYMNQETPYISGAIMMAENMSYSICEECGKPGKQRGGSYIQILCDTHHKAKEKSNKEKK